MCIKQTNKEKTENPHRSRSQEIIPMSKFKYALAIA